MKLKAEDVKALIDDLSDILRDNRDVIESDPRISRPFHEAETAAHIKYEHLQEKPPADGRNL